MELMKEDFDKLDVDMTILPELRRMKRSVIWWMVPVYLLLIVVIIVLCCHVAIMSSAVSSTAQSVLVTSTVQPPVTSTTQSPHREISPETTSSTIEITDPGSALVQVAGECSVGSGGVGGGVFSHYTVYQSYGRITALDLKIAEGQIRGMRVRYGEQFTSWSGDYNNPYIRVLLNTGELITGMVVYEGSWNTIDVIQGLELFTSLGRRLGPYGSTGDNIVNGTWDELLYFSGNCGHAIDGLTIHARGCVLGSQT